MNSGESSRNAAPSRLPGRRVRFGMALVFLAAMAFAAGVEVWGVHHHDTVGAHPNCAICRIVEAQAGSVPQAAAPVMQDLPQAPDEPQQLVAVWIPAPYRVHIRLRAPPVS